MNQENDIIYVHIKSTAWWQGFVYDLILEIVISHQSKLLQLVLKFPPCLLSCAGGGCVSFWPERLRAFMKIFTADGKYMKKSDEVA